MPKKLLAALATAALAAGLSVVAIASASAQDIEATALSVVTETVADPPVVTEMAAILPVAAIVDEVSDIVLTDTTDCAEDTAHTLRVRNPDRAEALGNDSSGGTPITGCAIIAPRAMIAVTECVYDSNGKAEFREVRITFDNSKSNVAVGFTVPWFSSFDRTVAAGETVTFRASNIWPTGGGYSVVANGQTFSLPIARCAEPVKPADEVATVANLPTSFDCAAGMVNFTTTTYTTSFVFDAPSVTWVPEKMVEGPTVPSTRAFTQQETADHCATAASETPRVSSCSTTDDQSPYTRWIHLVLDPALEYSIFHDPTDVKTVPTSNYVELAVGNYTVRVAAASGYLLNPGATESWSLTVVDSASCTSSPTPTPGPSPTPSPIPTTGGPNAPAQGASSGGDEIIAAAALSALPTLDFVTDGAAGDASLNPAPGDPAPGSRVDVVLKTQNPIVVSVGYAAIAALTVLLLCALALLVRRYRAAGNQ